MYLYLACWRVTTGKSEEVGYGEGGRKAFFAALAPVGRLLGYRDHYPKYGGGSGSSRSAAHGEGNGEGSGRGGLAVGGILLLAWVGAAPGFSIGPDGRRTGTSTARESGMGVHPFLLFLGGGGSHGDPRDLVAGFLDGALYPLPL